MRKLLLIILLILPFTFVSDNHTPLHKEKSESMVEPIAQEVQPIEDTSPSTQYGHNKKLVEYLENALKTKNFGDGKKTFTDTVLVYSYSMEEGFEQTRLQIVDFFNEMVGTTTMYNFEIYHTEEKGDDIYTLRYYFLSYDRYGNGFIDDITFYFVESKGLIHSVYGP